MSTRAPRGEVTARGSGLRCLAVDDVVVLSQGAGATGCSLKREVVTQYEAAETGGGRRNRRVRGVNMTRASFDCSLEWIGSPKELTSFAVAVALSCYCVVVLLVKIHVLEVTSGSQGTLKRAFHKREWPRF